MKINIILKDTSVFVDDLSEKQVKDFVKSVLSDFKVRLKRIIPDLGIIFVSSEEIQKLNSRFRGINKPTDVLSFNSEEDGYLGDIIISKEVVLEYANKFNCPFKEELQRDILHGIMHLLGYDHIGELKEGSNEDMFLIQEDILKKLK